MKILYCIGSLAQTGGTEKVLANKANYFVETLGYNVQILINEQNEKAFAYQYSDKIIMHDMKLSSYLKKPIIPYLSYKLLQFKIAKVYKDKIKDISPDIIIVAQHGIEDFIIPKLGLNIPTVREFHFSTQAIWETSKLINNIFKRSLFKFKKKRILKKMNGYDHIVLLTQRDQTYGNYKAKTTVIQNMLDITRDDFSINKNKINYKRVISVGSMHDRRKGFHTQINLWSKIIENHPDWVLDIYGDGVERKNLQKQIDNLNLNNNVILHGNTNEIMSKYKESSFFLMTSIAEGLPMVLIEAMSCGLPCVSFDCPDGPSEIINQNKNGFIIEDRSLENLYNQVEKLISNEDLLLSFSENALETSKNYSIENISKKWISFFNEITAE
ncbi:poly(glycerol-phosphate) alpha-glucosyltransferase [Algibacter lectus]|uniref:Poly(Glycerol-phosphate) alpha-glucosyltransferase n=1 Tax=Algibacter lectus TaxID=221126 RepID=A0A090WKV6_9FLAO|nr:glycosyltransferase family 4 protein [Algibacter lectus]GAL77631.1 poly(glycerol-phosphate) alpha-glucosyltransferase [Algibacter lectus]